MDDDGRQSKINTYLRQGVVQTGISGGTAAEKKIERVFFENGKTAAAAYNRDPAHDHFYPMNGQRRPQGWRPSAVWGVIAAK